MKLERLALWEEKYLFTEQGETEKGFIGWLKGNFDEDGLKLSDIISPNGLINRKETVI